MNLYNNEWDNFFKVNSGNKWPDNEVIKHISRLNSNLNFKKETLCIADLGCGSGNNINLCLNFSDQITAIDYSKKALERLSITYKNAIEKNKVELIQLDLNNEEINLWENLGNNYDRLYLDCTCLQHISSDSRLKFIKKIYKESQYNQRTFLITKTLIYQSKDSGFESNIISKETLLNLYSKYTKILEKTITTIEEEETKQTYLTLTLQFESNY